VDIGYAVDEQVPSSRGHSRRSGGVAPLQEVAVTTNGGGCVGLARGEAQHDGLEIRRALWVSHSANNALYSGLRFLDIPDLHLLTERDAGWQRLQIAAGSVNFFKLDVNLEWTVKNLMVERLTMSRIS